MDKDEQSTTTQAQTGQQPAEQPAAGNTQDFAQPKPKAKNASLDLKSLKQDVARYGRAVQRHGYFLFVVVLLAGLGAGLHLISETLELKKQDYKQSQLGEVKQAYQLTRNKQVEDKVLQSQQAGSGAIKPNYVPSRDNPFVEN